MQKVGKKTTLWNLLDTLTCPVGVSSNFEYPDCIEMLATLSIKWMSKRDKYDRWTLASLEGKRSLIVKVKSSKVVEESDHSYKSSVFKSFDHSTRIEMKYHLAVICLTVLCLCVTGFVVPNFNDTLTVPNDTQTETTFAPVENVTATTQALKTMKQHMSSRVYQNPPANPLGYCIFRQFTCSNIRPCCSGQCDPKRFHCL